MAKRRNWQAALTPIADAFRDIALMQMREESQRRLQTEDDERQQALARFNRKSIEDQAAAQREISMGSSYLNKLTPRAARRSVEAGQGKVAGIDISPLAETDADIAAAMADEVAKVDSLAKLRSNNQATSEFQLQGGKVGGPVPLEPTSGPLGFRPDDPLARLHRTLDERRGVLTEENLKAQMAEPRYNPATRATERTLRDGTVVRAAGEEGQTPIEQGQNLKLKDMFGKFDKDYTRWEIEKANELETGTRNPKMDTLYQEEFIKSLFDKTGAGAGGAGSGDLGNSQLVREGREMIKQAELLNNQETGLPATWSGIYGGIQGKLGYNTTRRLLDSGRRAFRTAFAQFLGHKGVLTQQDAEATEEILPGGGFTVADSNAQNQRFGRILDAIERMPPLPPIPEDLPEKVRSAEYQRRLNMLLQRAGAPPPAGPPEMDAADLLKTLRGGGGY